MKDKIIKIWKETFGIENIPTNKDLIELDIDSILLLELLMRIEKEFNIVLPIEFLEENRTIDNMHLFINNYKGY